MPIIDKRALGPIYKVSGSRVEATPNFNSLKNWAKAQEKKGLPYHQEILVAYEETKNVGLTEDFPVETGQVRTFTLEQILKLKLKKSKQKA